jgi:hypothetical protein
MPTRRPFDELIAQEVSNQRSSTPCGREIGARVPPQGRCKLRRTMKRSSQ